MFFTRSGSIHFIYFDVIFNMLWLFLYLSLKIYMYIRCEHAFSDTIVCSYSFEISLPISKQKLALNDTGVKEYTNCLTVLTDAMFRWPLFTPFRGLCVRSALFVSKNAGEHVRCLVCGKLPPVIMERNSSFLPRLSNWRY